MLLLPLLALLGYAMPERGGWSIFVILALLLVWLLGIVRLALRATKVSCPACLTVYARSKYRMHCPHCGLRMFQEDPNEDPNDA
jgi:ribosomal protein S27AE